MLANHGWPHSFRESDWEDIAEFLGTMADADPGFRHMADIAASVLAAGVSDQMAGCTSMHDIVVVQRPIQEPPYDAIVVRAPESLRRPRPGHVLIEHTSRTGHTDAIERSTDEAVPLFWRFAREKLGIERDA